MNALYGLVLAGGQSRRMGSDKAHLKLGNKSLLHIMQQRLQDSGCKQVIVSSNHLEYAIPDVFANYGPVAGIHAGIKYYIEENKPGNLLIVPVDMPNLTASLLEKLIKSEARADLYHFDSYQFPLLLTINSENLKKIENLLANTTIEQGISIKRMFREFNEHIITVSSEELPNFVNCNSKADLAALKS